MARIGLSRTHRKSLIQSSSVYQASAKTAPASDNSLLTSAVAGWVHRAVESRQDRTVKQERRGTKMATDGLHVVYL